MIKNYADSVSMADTIIVGGGMVGMSLAIALAEAGLKVMLTDKAVLSAQLDPAFDGRVSAISQGSARVLDHLGVWDNMLRDAEPILDIRVADGDSTSHVHYNHNDIQDSKNERIVPMGHMVENRHIRTALQKKAAALATLTLKAPMEVTQLARDAYGALVTLSDGSSWRASLVIAADGKHSAIRTAAGIRTLSTHYKQTAIVCTIHHELPHEGLALERFLPAGPFAALPMTGNRSAIVWTVDEEDAPYLLALPDSAFGREVAKGIGGYLGEITPFGKRFSYPLTLTLATRYIDTRLVLVGDAAHAIHPIAGQGVNVGFRDVAVLTELLIEARQLGLDIGASTILKHYQRWRRFDAMTMGAVTDGINRLFSTDRPLLRIARRAGLRAVNNTPFLKRFFIKDAMGLTGDLPKMMQAS